MTPRATKPHPMAVRNREARVDALVAEIWRMADKLPPWMVLSTVARWTEIEWACAALNLGKRAPSLETRNAVLATIARADLVERMAEAGC